MIEICPNCAIEIEYGETDDAERAEQCANFVENYPGVCFPNRLNFGGTVCEICGGWTDSYYEGEEI